MKVNLNMVNNLLCDSDGVPRLVQKIAYISSDMTLSATFFNGKSRIFMADHLIPSLDLMQGNLTTMQELEAEQRINEVAEGAWRTWFPHLRVVKD